MSAQLGDLADRLDATPPSLFATWTSPDGTPAGFPTYHPVEAQWRDAVTHAGLLVPNPVYDGILAGDISRPTVENVRVAGLPELRGYATYIVRGERFSDGHIGACHKQGLLAALVRRLADLDAST